MTNSLAMKCADLVRMDEAAEMLAAFDEKYRLWGARPEEVNVAPVAFPAGCPSHR